MLITLNTEPETKRALRRAACARLDALWDSGTQADPEEAAEVLIAEARAIAAAWVRARGATAGART